MICATAPHHEVISRAVQFTSLRVELRRKLAEFFLGRQLEAVVACRPAPGSKGAEVVSGHELSPHQEHEQETFSAVVIMLNVSGTP